MPELVPIQIDETTVIYVEPAAAVQVPAPAPAQLPGELTREDLGRGDKGAVEETTRRAMQSFAAMETTIKTYAQRTLNAFQDLASANMDKVHLEFGITLGGEAGVPYVTQGTAECSLKISVERSFSSQKPG